MGLSVYNVCHRFKYNFLTVCSDCLPPNEAIHLTVSSITPQTIGNGSTLFVVTYFPPASGVVEQVSGQCSHIIISHKEKFKLLFQQGWPKFHNFTGLH